MKKTRIPIGYNKMYLITPVVYEKLKTCLDKSDKQALERVNRPFFNPQQQVDAPGIFNVPPPPPPPSLPFQPRREEENEDPEMDFENAPYNPNEDYDENFPELEGPPQHFEFNLPMEQPIDPEPDMPEQMEVQEEAFPLPPPPRIKKTRPPSEGLMKRIRFFEGEKLKRKPKTDDRVMTQPLQFPIVVDQPIPSATIQQPQLSLEYHSQRPLAIDYLSRNASNQQPELQYEVPVDVSQPQPSDYLPIEFQREIEGMARSSNSNPTERGRKVKRLQRKTKTKVTSGPEEIEPQQPIALDYQPELPPISQIQHRPSLQAYDIPMEVERQRIRGNYRNINPNVPALTFKRAYEENLAGALAKKASTDLSTRGNRTLQRSLTEVPSIEHQSNLLPITYLQRQSLPALTYETGTLQRQETREIEPVEQYPLRIYRDLPQSQYTTPYTVEFPPEELPDRQSRKRSQAAEIVPPEKIIRNVYSNKKRKLNPPQGKKRKQTGVSANPQPNLFSDKRLKLNPTREYQSFKDPRYSNTGYIPINIDLPVKRKKLFKCENCGMFLSSSYNLTRHKEREARRLNIGGEIRNNDNDGSFVDWSLVRGIKKERLDDQPALSGTETIEPRRYETRASAEARRKNKTSFPVWE